MLCGSALFLMTNKQYTIFLAQGALKLLSQTFCIRQTLWQGAGPLSFSGELKSGIFIKLGAAGLFIIVQNAVFNGWHKIKLRFDPPLGSYGGPIVRILFGQSQNWHLWFSIWLGLVVKDGKTALKPMRGSIWRVREKVDQVLWPLFAGG